MLWIQFIKMRCERSSANSGEHCRSGIGDWFKWLDLRAHLNHHLVRGVSPLVPLRTLITEKIAYGLWEGVKITVSWKQMSSQRPRDLKFDLWIVRYMYTRDNFHSLLLNKLKSACTSCDVTAISVNHVTTAHYTYQMYLCRTFFSGLIATRLRVPFSPSAVTKQNLSTSITKDGNYCVVKLLRIFLPTCPSSK